MVCNKLESGVMDKMLCKVFYIVILAEGIRRNICVNWFLICANGLGDIA